MYEDKTLVCKDCGKEFVFTADEQKITKLPVQSAESHVLCPLSRQTDALYIAATVSQKETVSNRLE